MKLGWSVSAARSRRRSDPGSPFWGQECGHPAYLGHGGSPTVHVVPAGDVTADVGAVVPVIGVVELLPPEGLTATAALVTAGVVVAAPDPATPSDVVMLAASGEVTIEELRDPAEAVLPPGVELLELIDDESGGLGAV